MVFSDQAAGSQQSVKDIVLSENVPQSNESVLPTVESATSIDLSTATVQNEQYILQNHKPLEIPQLSDNISAVSENSLPKNIPSSQPQDSSLYPNQNGYNDSSIQSEYKKLNSEINIIQEQQNITLDISAQEQNNIQSNTKNTSSVVEPSLTSSINTEPILEKVSNLIHPASSNSQNLDNDTDISSDISNSCDNSSDDDINMSELQIDSEDEDFNKLSDIPKTKNEILNPEAPVIEFDSIPNDTPIKYVGYVQSTIDRTVVVKGIISGEQKVLDYGSILVFDDYSILGAVFDTFGPVRCPLYSILFKNSQDIDRTKISINRKVFVAEIKSNYALTSSLNVKGSDASNLNDEEISESDIEFSDDEQEIKFKKWLKSQKNASRTKNNNSNRNTFSKTQNAGYLNRGGKTPKNIPNPAQHDNSLSQIDHGVEAGKKLVNYGNTEFDSDLGF
ncbi:hypothetical protein BB561_001424 [Smittium simulii]|uniref:H/ACA ribonucleoprotein complex non-core subunit NAF1 n=1 Tax=Smittium simulii TaxID=133385 RepID=A0A2T9YUS6_9FUNG|nr:hypothetical protein BB561_001424 [Smittium simulii]